MADPLAPPASREPLAYRPLSGFALAGLITSALFALMLLVGGVVALSQGVPIFLPPWTLLAAGLGLVLSLVGLNQIRHSEGTRAGQGLARAGVWISLLTGLGYFAYYYATSLALTRQANDFLMSTSSESPGFFPLLSKGVSDPATLNSAFLLTLPATSRGSIKPDDEGAMLRAFDASGPDGMAGNLSQFRDHFLVQLYRAAPQETTVEPLGVQNWDYENRSYKVLRNYRLRSPEAELNLVVPTQSTEGEKAGQPRQWFVVVNQIAKGVPRYTPFGEALNGFRMQSRIALDRWVKSLYEGQIHPDFKRLDRTDWDKIGSTEEIRADAKRRLQELFARSDPERPFMISSLSEALGGWRKRDNHLELQHRFRVALGSASKDNPQLGVEGVFITQSKDAIDPAAPAPMPEWEVVGVQINRTFLGDPRKQR